MIGIFNVFSAASLMKFFGRTGVVAGADAEFLSSQSANGADETALNRDESFRIEALEPRILLSADPIENGSAKVVHEVA